MLYVYNILCGNARVRDSERFFCLLQTFTIPFGYTVTWKGKRLLLRGEECGGGRRIGAHETYKNKLWIAESSHDRRHDKLLHGSRCLHWVAITNNRSRRIPFARHRYPDLFCQSSQNAWNRETKSLNSSKIWVTKHEFRFQKLFPRMPVTWWLSTFVEL